MTTCMCYTGIKSGTHAVLMPIPPYCKFNPKILEKKKGSLDFNDKQEVCRKSLWREEKKL